MARIRKHPRFTKATPKQVATGFALQHAQHIIARELDYASWPKLVAAIERSEVDYPRRGAQTDDRRCTKDELRGLERLHDSLAVYLRDIMQQAGDADIDVDIYCADQVTWAEFQGSRPVGCWSYSYIPQPLKGPAIFDLPVQMARSIAATTAGHFKAAFVDSLEEVVEGTREFESLSGDEHRRFAGQLWENGIEAVWAQVMAMDMAEIYCEYDPELPQRKVADPADNVAYVQLATSEIDVAMRLCYPYSTLEPQLPALAEFGKRKG